MVQLPHVTVAGAVDHALVAHFGVSIYPNHNQLRLLLFQLGTQGGNIIKVTDLLRKGGVNQHNIIVLQRFHSKVQNHTIFQVTDIFFKKDAAAVIRLVRHRKDLLGQRDQGILIQIDNVVQRFCQLLGNKGFSAGRRACDQYQLFHAQTPLQKDCHLINQVTGIIIHQTFVLGNR